MITARQERLWKHDQGLSFFLYCNSFELIRCYSGVTKKTEAGGLLSLRGLTKRGVKGWWGVPPPYSSGENNECIITQHPKHLL